MTLSRAERISSIGHVGRILVRGLVLAALIGWFIWLRPQVLGGPATYIVVSGTSMEPVYHAGDLVIVGQTNAYASGEIVAYRIPAGEPAAGYQVIHRIVGGDASAGFLMRGDNTNGPDQWHPKAGDMLGRELFFIPGAAQVLLLLRNPLLLGSLAAAFVTAWLMLPGTRPAAPQVRPPVAARPRHPWSRVPAPR